MRIPSAFLPFFVGLDESGKNSYIIQKWPIDIFSTLVYSVLSTQR